MYQRKVILIVSQTLGQLAGGGEEQPAGVLVGHGHNLQQCGAGEFGGGLVGDGHSLGGDGGKPGGVLGGDGYV